MNIPEDQYIKVGRVNTRYWKVGKGAPVLLIHGITNSVEDWLLNIPALAERYCVYAVDLVGHGKTDKPLNISYHLKDLANFIQEFIQAVDIPPANLIGHSLGGWIALRIAIDQPALIQKLVLVASAGLGKETPLEIRLITVPGVGEFLGKRVLDIAFEQYLARQRENWPDATTATVQMIRLKYDATRWSNISPTVLKTFRTLANVLGTKDREYLPIVGNLASIQSPLLVIWGQQDKIVPVAWTQKLSKSCPQAQIEIFDHCGHDAMVEHPRQFNQLVLEFLEN